MPLHFFVKRSNLFFLIKLKIKFVISILCEGVENTSEDLLPFLITIPLQKLAYYSALKRGYDIDKPRNLAKSVTVE